MDMMGSLSVIFYTVATYSFYSNKRYFMGIEEKTAPKTLKCIAKDLDISVFGVV